MYEPSEYQNETRGSRERELNGRIAAAQQEKDERDAREMAFQETPYCSNACSRDAIHTPGCSAANNPVHAALAGWVSGQRYAFIAPGIAVRTGKRKVA